MSHTVDSAAAEFARRQQSPLQKVQHQLHARPWLSPLFLLLVTLPFAAVRSTTADAHA